ncbi:M42 family metallopeptidase [Sedimentibacter sp. zth1]|uniref:M42 family metallopeptidase n=1 Tax=Sedimentibacter sp. zth1 TaxID=2816908 RepID=UPI001A932BBE|nr:M42 family metallopeptidase [Sedimentibacter sp. zth1]QSX06782.1 M42 family metallopeptidase [Sedimentibacter sp. zth1]
MFLKELTTLSGVSGCEFEVRNYIKQKLDEIGCEYKVDKIGNVIAHNIGKAKSKKIMLTAHMDEVGFMVSSIDDSGFIKFSTVGGIDPRTLNSKLVEIGEDKVPGVIGSKAIHLMTAEERGATIPVKSLYIDIGSTSKESTEEKVNIGDYVSFKSDYVEFGDNLIKAKALDDRTGCSAILELLAMKLDIDYYGCFAVMEEVGGIGSKVVADVVDPDFSIVLEGTISADMPEVKDNDKVTVLGKGPAVSLMDGSTIYNLDDVNFVKEVAKKNNIAYQFRRSNAGSTDAGSINTRKAGSRVVTLSTPCRYIHSPISVASKDDYENVVKLTKAIIEEIK